MRSKIIGAIAGISMLGGVHVNAQEVNQNPITAGSFTISLEVKGKINTLLSQCSRFGDRDILQCQLGINKIIHDFAQYSGRVCLQIAYKKGEAPTDQCFNKEMNLFLDGGVEIVFKDQEAL